MEVRGRPFIPTKKLCLESLERESGSETPSADNHMRNELLVATLPTLFASELSEPGVAGSGAFDGVVVIRPL